MNFQEAIIHSLIVRASAVNTEVIAMQADDVSRDIAGRYQESAYLKKAQELYDIHNEIQGIARNGYL